MAVAKRVTHWNYKNLMLALALGLASLTSSCGPGTPVEASLAATSTSCPAGAAEILVGEGFVKRLCGCTEASNTLFVSGDSLSCTVAAGTTIFFYYAYFAGSSSLHQIESVGSPSFSPSRMTDPERPAVHAVTLSTTGTYLFRDAFNHAVGGSFTVL